ncbi:MAG: Clp protease N-terminal domain-containing protein [Terracoccus sp.]
MFDRLSENSRRVIALAQEESRLLAHHDIGAEHLVLGLLRVDDDETARTVLGVTLVAAHQAVASVSPPEWSASTAYVQFTTNAKRALELASLESRRQNEQTGVGHLLLGVLAVNDQRVVQALTMLGVDLDAAYSLTRRLVTGGTEAARELGSGAGDARPTTTFAPDRQGAKQGSSRRHVLVSALRRFGRHDDDCDAPASACTCGFDAALADADRGPASG